MIKLVFKGKKPAPVRELPDSGFISPEQVVEVSDRKAEQLLEQPCWSKYRPATKKKKEGED